MVQKRKDRIEFLTPADKVEMGLIDLSESGVAILHPKPVSSQAAINIQIENIQLIAKVIYCREQVGAYKIGMQFIEVATEKAAILKGLVEKFSRGIPLEIKLNP